MSHHSDTPFDSIESSHEYVKLLAEAIALAVSEIEAEIALVEPNIPERRKEALRLVAFKLNKLSSHMNASRRILNDLRSLHRLLFEERSSPGTSSEAVLEREAPSERYFVAVTE